MNRSRRADRSILIWGMWWTLIQSYHCCYFRQVQIRYRAVYGSICIGGLGGSTANEPYERVRRKGIYEVEMYVHKESWPAVEGVVIVRTENKDALGELGKDSIPDPRDGEDCLSQQFKLPAPRCYIE